MTDAAFFLLIVGGTFVLAGFVKGVVGLGLPTIAMGLLGLAMPPAQAAALLVVPSLVTNAWQLLAGPRLGGLVRRLWPMQAAVVLGTLVGMLAGPGLAQAGAAGRAPVLLGAALAAYALAGLARLRFSVSPAAERWASPLAGAVTGVVTAFTGVFVIPAVPYLQALGVEREDLIQALGLSFTVSTVALAAGLAMQGAFAPGVAGQSLLALAPAIGGMLVGQAVRTRIPQEPFRRVFLFGLLALGLHLALSGLF